MKNRLRKCSRSGFFSCRLAVLFSALFHFLPLRGSKAFAHDDAMSKDLTQVMNSMIGLDLIRLLRPPQVPHPFRFLWAPPLSESRGLRWYCARPIPHVLVFFPVAYPNAGNGRLVTRFFPWNTVGSHNPSLPFIYSF